MPTPQTNETRNEFLNRCMSDEESNTDFPDNDQRFAFCNSVYDNKNHNRYHDDCDCDSDDTDCECDEKENETKAPTGKLKESLQNKVKEHNEKVGNNQSKRTTVNTLFTVYKRGVGAYRTNPGSVRPNVSSPEQWAMARVNSFLYCLRNGRFRGGKHDTDLLPKGHPQSSKSLKKSYTDYPKSATNNAKRAKKWLDENNNPNNCLTSVGKQRMNQLANREPLSRDVVGRMAKFKRHQQHKDVPYSEGCGGIAWDAWGGTSGIEWAIRTIENENKMKKDYNYRNNTFLNIKDVDTKNRIVAGYFSAFNNVDSDGDLIRKGSFSKSINERGPNSSSNRKIAHLAYHDVRRPIGVIQKLQEDDFGLYFESKLGTHTDGDDALKMYESGIIKEHSIGFQYIDDKTNWVDYEKNDNVTLTEEGKSFVDSKKGYYEINEVKLWEGSYVTFGANSSTPSYGVIKSDEDKKEVLENINSRMMLLRKELGNGTYTDNCFKLLAQELAYIQEQYTTLLNIEPVITTHKDKAVNDNKIREFLIYTLPNINKF
tara:strand:+ start:9217 stop:10839 length:1623 start_codon:yes stop_codon:yes gene_type:complete